MQEVHGLLLDRSDFFALRIVDSCELMKRLRYKHPLIQYFLNKSKDLVFNLATLSERIIHVLTSCIRDHDSTDTLRPYHIPEPSSPTSEESVVLAQERTSQGQRVRNWNRTIPYILK